MKTKTYLIFTLLICCSIKLISQEIKRDIISSQLSIPIDYRGNHIYIKGTVQKIEGNFIFDTGADNLYFDSLFYNDNLKYDSIRFSTLSGVGISSQNVKIIMNTVEFDFSDYHSSAKFVYVLSLKTLVGDFADGIIGLNFFLNKSLEINYQQKYIKIHDEIDSSLLLQYSKIQCKHIKNRLYVPLTININDNISISDMFMLDLGSAGSVSITRSMAKKNKLNKNIKNKVKYYTNYGGVGGKSESYYFIANSIDIGEYILGKFEADYFTDKRGALSSKKYAGLLGNEILERFDVIIDFRTSCLYIKPNAVFSEKFNVSKLGFKFVDRRETFGALIVTGLFENSSASKSGLQIDDKIIEINNISIKEIDYDELNNFINKTNTLILKVERATELLNIEIIQSKILITNER